MITHLLNTPQYPLLRIAKFNIPALLEHGSQLRNVPCSCDLTQRPLSGSLNWAIFLSFEDGVEWVFRSPTTGEDDISLEVAGELLASSWVFPVEENVGWLEFAFGVEVWL